MSDNENIAALILSATAETETPERSSMETPTALLDADEMSRPL